MAEEQGWLGHGVQPFTAALPRSRSAGAGSLAGLHRRETSVTCALLRLLQMEPGSGERATLFVTLPLSPHLSVILSDVSNAKSIILRIFKNVRARRDSRAICATASFHSPERFQAEGFAQDTCLV